MQLYSTNSPQLRSTFREALFQGLPPDNGLYMPLHIPQMPRLFVEELPELPFSEIAFRLAEALIGDEIPPQALRSIAEEAFSFPVPLAALDEQTAVLELFHGPSLAFKDFGARFMAQVMSYFNRNASGELIILVATSGDTGGAVAAGFHRTPGIRVVILYPAGKVSPLQERQLTTLNENITAVAVEGTFDDCQALVKQAFLDDRLRQNLRLSSANSINIARLIPQIFYYWEAYKQARPYKRPVVFSVPSGNFGNLTAGLIAQRMGLPARHFIAATNRNDTVPRYLDTGRFEPKRSVSTLSNAMDVGNPSNFARIQSLYGSTWNTVRAHLSAYAFDDHSTRTAVKTVFEQHGYVLDPHTAVGYLAWRTYQQRTSSSDLGIVLGTAHPAKFSEEVSEILQAPLPLPTALAELLQKEQHKVHLSSRYSDFREWLLEYGQAKL